MTLDLIGAAVGALLTVMILTYFIGDNFLYRLALHILVGVTVGYGVAVAVVTVILRIVLPALQGGNIERWGTLVPLVLGLLLLFKGFPRWAAWGNLSTAFLIGVGAAVATGGALLGTIVPQVAATGSFAGWLRGGVAELVAGVLVVIGTVSALLVFTFSVPQNHMLRNLWNGTVGVVGKAFLLAAFGAGFATALTASLSILVGRIYALIEVIQQILQVAGG